MEQQAREGYLKFREMCGRNTEMIMKCLNKMKEDGLLKYLVGMEGLTVFEEEYIEQLMNDESPD